MYHRSFTTPIWTAFWMTAVILFGSAWLATPSFAGPSAKVLVCHIPPDDPDNFHTIKINEKALSAHLAHGDIPGSCNALCAALCDDGDACTVDDTGECEESGCPAAPRDPVDCSDGLNCTVDSCDPVDGCANDPVVCTPSDACHISSCAEPEGSCMETAKVCDPGDVCNVATGTCMTPPPPPGPTVTCPCAPDGVYACVRPNDVELVSCEIDISTTANSEIVQGDFTCAARTRTLDFNLNDTYIQCNYSCANGDVSGSMTITEEEYDSCVAELLDFAASEPVCN